MEHNYNADGSKKPRYTGSRRRFYRLGVALFQKNSLKTHNFSKHHFPRKNRCTTSLIALTECVSDLPHRNLTHETRYGIKTSQA